MQSASSSAAAAASSLHPSLDPELLTHRLLEGKVAAAINRPAGAAQEEAIRELRVKITRKFQTVIADAADEMEAVNKHARTSCVELFTVAELHKHFADLIVQQVTIRLKGYARRDIDGKYPAAEPTETVPWDLNAFLSTPDTRADLHQDIDFRDTSDEVLLTCEDRDSATPSKENAQRVLEATSDGKRFKAGVLKIATVKFTLACRNAREIELMCERALEKTPGGFKSVKASLLGLAIQVGNLDPRFEWQLHSDRTDKCSPIVAFEGVLVTRAGRDPMHCWAIDTFQWQTPTDQLRVIKETDPVDAVIFPPTLRRSGKVKFYSHFFNKPYPLLQSARSNEEYDDDFEEDE